MAFLRVLGGDMLPIAELDNVGELEYTRRFFEPGAWAVQLPYFDGALDIISRGVYFLVEGDPAGACLLERVEIEDGEAPTISLSGTTLSGVLGRRIILPLDGDNFQRVVEQPAESIMHEFVNMQAIAPRDERRRMEELQAAQDLRRGVTASWRATLWDRLTEVLTDIGVFAGLGYNVRLELPQRKWLFEVLEGRELSAGKPDQRRPIVVFGAGLDNLGRVVFEENRAEHKNAVYALSGNVEANEFVVILARGEGRGSELREVFHNASSMAEDTAQLGMVAGMRLRDLALQPTITGDVLDTASFRYKKDWDLGDIVTVVHDSAGKVIHQRITEVTQVFTQNANKLQVRFGTDHADPVRLIKRMKRSTRV